jgi:hypothetical protein
LVVMTCMFSLEIMTFPSDFKPLRSFSASHILNPSIQYIPDWRARVLGGEVHA